MHQQGKGSGGCNKGGGGVKAMILLIDNYDSFSYNLYQLVGELNSDIRVIRNDELSVEDIRSLSPSHIILSPGPGRPEDAGVCVDVVRELSGQVPILGVCLGHQAICVAFGATVTHAKRLMHGKQSYTDIDQSSPVFSGLKERIQVARYHSLSADESTLPDELIVTARADDGEIMAVSHREHPTYGMQFHPESIMTFDGRSMLKNFLQCSNIQPEISGRL